MRAEEYVPPFIALALTMMSARKCLRKTIDVVQDANGRSFLTGENVVRFYPEQFEQARENELLSDSVVFVKKVEALGPRPKDFSVVPFFTEFNGRQIVNIEAEIGTHFYGGGEISSGLCLNNESFLTWNLDSHYGKASVNLYQSHPYFMAVRPDGTSYGVIANTTYPLKFSMTDTSVRIENWGKFDKTHDWQKATPDPNASAFSVTVFEGSDPKAVVKKLAELTGYIQLPPKWSIGYHQCRWSYYPDTEALRVAKAFREKKIPCDVIWFDIHYMKDYKIFTFDDETFPNPKKLNDELHEMGFHTVWMIDPGIAQREGYFVHDQCVGQKLAILKSINSEEPVTGNVWPGACVFPDFTLDETDKWWQTLYPDFMAQGVDGVWNDMNEPAVIGSLNRTLDLNAYHRGMGGGNHTKFHNIYGVLMVKSSRDGILNSNPDLRPFVLSRASFLGGHRYAATWTGDNASNWEHLKLSISMIINLGLSGQPFSGPDIGGFFDDADPELFARWIGFGSLLPFSRGHTHHNSHPHEPWAFGEKAELTSRVALNRRYKLLPYFYTQFYNASVKGLPIILPTYFIDFTNQALRKEDNSFLIGKNLLVLVNTSKDTVEMHVNPAITNNPHWHDLYLDSEIDHNLPRMMIREGGIIATQGVEQHVGQTAPEKVELHLYVCLDKSGFAKGKLYEDEGNGFEYQKGFYCLMRFTAQQTDDNNIQISTKHKGNYKIPLSCKVTATIVNRDDNIIVSVC
jgi:alpha-glucosidase